MKDPSRVAHVQAVCTQGLNLFRVLALYLKPVLPQLIAKVETFFAAGELGWASIATPLLGARINPYEPLAVRVDSKAAAALLAASMEQIAPSREPAPTTITDTDIAVEDFAKLDLRIARIVAAETVEGADKLLKLSLDLGELGQRTVFAGIRSAYDCSALVGRLTVVLANLKPRKMRFGTSAGMVLAAGPGGKDIFLLSPDAGAQPGMQVK
jgi:methionyl-tRNA synthetase